MKPGRLDPQNPTLGQKIWHVHWMFIALLVCVAGIGFAMLYSAADGSMDPWASRQMARFGVGLALLFGVAMVDIRVWLRWAYFFYGICLLLLIAVEFGGAVRMGARRWIDLGVITLQPSELMKIALVLALARYFHGRSIEDVGRIAFLIPPIILMALPAAMVLSQPDLGTALMMIMVGSALFFLAGVKLWKFGVVGISALSCLPIVWRFLHEYQKQRVLTFLDPGRDPLGAGYHIIQSMIALGSGGAFGKGYMQGSQSHLNYLPEKHTDFIFTMLGEEFGLAGALALMGLYAILILYGCVIAASARSQFGRLVAMGVTTTFFLYIFINIAMVMGVIPVVGVPLPLISYGGTAMLTLMAGFGLLIGVHVHRDIAIGRRGIDND